MERLHDVINQLHLVQVRDREQLQAHVMRARHLAHAIRGDLAIVTGALSLLKQTATFSTEQDRDIDAALTGVLRITTNVESLHALVKTLAPDTTL